MKNLVLLFLICLYTGIVSAQEIRQKYIGVEAGLAFFESNMLNVDFIRKDMSSYSTGYSTNNISSNTYKSYIGIKPEYYTLNGKLGGMVGIRFSRVDNIVGKNNYMAEGNNYFYFLYRQDGLTTEYLKVKQIDQHAEYLGIPVEIRYFPFRPHFFRLYFKAGAEIDFRLQSKTDFSFDDKAMEIFQNDLTAKFEKPRAVNVLLYGAGGIRLGRKGKPSVSYEITLPYLYVTSEPTALANPIFGAGFQLNFQIPIKSRVQ